MQSAYFHDDQLVTSDHSILALLVMCSCIIDMTKNTTDFVVMYIKEVGKSDGALQDDIKVWEVSFLFLKPVPTSLIKFKCLLEMCLKHIECAVD